MVSVKTHSDVVPDFFLGEHALHDLPAHAREAGVHTGVKVGEPGVIEAHQVQNRRVQIGDVAAIFDGGEAQLVGRADRPVRLSRPRPASHIEKPCQL